MIEKKVLTLMCLIFIVGSGSPLYSGGVWQSNLDAQQAPGDVKKTSAFLDHIAVSPGYVRYKTLDIAVHSQILMNQIQLSRVRISCNAVSRETVGVDSELYPVYLEIQASAADCLSAIDFLNTYIDGGSSVDLDQATKLINTATEHTDVASNILSEY